MLRVSQWPPPPIRSPAWRRRWRSARARRRSGCSSSSTRTRRRSPTGSRTSSSTRCAAVIDVDAIDTESRDHATELCREAAQEGYDVVVAFGGDGTVNEAANGLAGSNTPLSCLPGGRTNVYCRMLGIPTDVVDATEHLLQIADAWQPRRVDIGTINDRAFLFSAGVGLDASVVEQVDAHPRLKARLGEWYYTWTGVQTFNRRYLIHPPRLEAELGERDGQRRHRDRPERRALHVLRRPAGRHGRGRDA